MKNIIISAIISATIGITALFGADTSAAERPAVYTVELQDPNIFNACGEIVEAVHTDDWRGYMVIRASYGTEYRAEIDPEDLDVGDPVIFTIYDPWEVGESFAEHYEHNAPQVIRVNIDQSRY